jgi:hypothetical protein
MDQYRNILMHIMEELAEGADAYEDGTEEHRAYEDALSAVARCYSVNPDDQLALHR